MSAPVVLTIPTLPGGTLETFADGSSVLSENVNWTITFTNPADPNDTITHSGSSVVPATPSQTD